METLIITHLCTDISFFLFFNCWFFWCQRLVLMMPESGIVCFVSFTFWPFCFRSSIIPGFSYPHVWLLLWTVSCDGCLCLSVWHCFFGSSSDSSLGTINLFMASRVRCFFPRVLSVSCLKAGYLSC